MLRVLSIFAIVLLDQLSKYLVVKNLKLGDIIDVFPSFCITLAHNYGVAFSIFHDDKGSATPFLLAFGVFITLIMSVWLYKTSRQEKWLVTGLVFIIGGAIGNLIDRSWHGYVIDFIDVYFKHHHWPTFNIADSFITIGAFLALAATWRDAKE